MRTWNQQAEFYFTHWQNPKSPDEKNNYQKILIIQDGAKILNDANKIFKEKFHKFKKDWQIIIFSNDYAGLAFKKEVYQELKKYIDLNKELDQCITEQIIKYKTYIFSNGIIKYWIKR